METFNFWYSDIIILLGLLRGLSVLKSDGCEKRFLALNITIEMIELAMILLTAIIQLGTIALLVYYRSTLTGTVV